MARNDHHTLDSALMTFDSVKIGQVISEIECHDNLEVIAGGSDNKKYDVMTVLGGKKIAITNISLNGEKYIAHFGIIPSRDFEDSKTRQEAEEIVAYLRRVFVFYA